MPHRGASGFAERTAQGSACPACPRCQLKQHSFFACVYRFRTTTSKVSTESANEEKKCLVKSGKVKLSQRPDTLKNATRVKSSIELGQIMKSLGSIHDFSYIGVIFSSKREQIAFFLLSLQASIGNSRERRMLYSINL